jgi:tetratricopeptide (TPR) repeat protein
MKDHRGMIDPAIEGQVRHIVAEFNAGRLDQACLACEDSLRRNPSEPSINHLFAAVLLAKGDVAKSRIHIEASLAARADNAPAQLLAGRIARLSGDFNLAISHLKRARELGPGTLIFFELARTFDAAGDRSGAREAWLAITRIDPASQEAAGRLGRILFEEGLPAEAAAVLERVAGSGSPASTWFDLGLVRQDLHDPIGAAEAYRKALEKRPDDAEAAVNLGIALQDSGDMTAATEAYQKAYGLQPKTLGTIAMSLTSAPQGQLWLDREALKRVLAV